MAQEKSAAELDATTPSNFRDHFLIPTREDIASSHIDTPSTSEEECTYLCGNSLGLQPKSTHHYVKSQLHRWRTKGVYGHFKHVTDDPIPPWLDFDERLQEPMSRIVGAQPSEVALMQTLSVNLHLLLSAFYKPTTARFKIMIEEKSFPSDHFIVESQLRHHGIDPADGMILLQPPSPDSPLLPLEHILTQINAHASTLAVLLLPGIQFYTGQYFDMSTITAHAQHHGVKVGWDLAHAVGNVPLSLHEWNVDFAAWCNYKYINAGPGAIGGLFVHERHTSHPHPTHTHGPVPDRDAPTPPHHARLQGWWGSTKASRFAMDNVFAPIPGASGFQISNPSALDLSALLAALSVFDRTSMSALGARSRKLTRYLESLLVHPLDDNYTIITPANPDERGAQLSLRLAPGLLEHVLIVLERESVVVDERKPDVVRVAPAPLYNTFGDCERFVQVFRGACAEAAAAAAVACVACVNGS